MASDDLLDDSFLLQNLTPESCEFARHNEDALVRLLKRLTATSDGEVKVTMINRNISGWEFTVKET